MSTLDPLVGKVVADRYEIGSLIKAGGMGAVYRAKQHSLGRDVAIKFLRPQVVDDESAQRFMSEARAASRMNHPHVVSVFDFGRTSEADGELLFLVMELVTGLDLCETVIHGGPMPLTRVPVIIGQTLQALGEAHHHGIIHRDVKPENIILASRRSGADHVKMIDFGIARVQSEKRITAARQVCGTVAYIAPESALGEAAGPAADLYSMGVVLFELLTGKLPFERSTPSATLLAHVSAPRPDPRQIAPERNIPAALAEICMRAMAIKPEERFASAEAFEQTIWRATRRVVDSPVPPRPSQAPPSAQARATTLAYPLPNDTARPPPHAADESERPGLIGRDHDLAWARARLQASSPCWLSLTGRPGVGKSHLLRAIGEIAEEQGSVVVPVILDPPPFNELGYRGLRRLIVQLTGLGLGDLVAGHSVGPINKHAREGLRALSPRAPAWRSDPEGTRRDAAAALAWAARRAAASGSGRVVVLLDDLEHLDLASRNALIDQQRTEPVPGFTIVSASESPITGMEGLILCRQLAGLSRTEALRMLAVRRSDAVLARTDDDIEPLYIEQIARLSASRSTSAPATLNALVEWQLHDLAPAQRNVLQALAIVGMASPFKLDALLGTTSEPTERAEDTQTNLRPLTQYGFLAPRDQQVVLSHAIFGRVALAHAPGGVIAELHTVAEAQLSPTQAWLELRAYHAIRGRGDFDAFVALEDTARLRTSHGDAAGAIAALWQAVSTARVQIMRGEGGSATSALSVFGRKLATALINDGRLDEAQGILDEILTVAEPTDAGRALVLEQLAAIAHLRGRPAEAARHRQEALAVAEGSGDANTIERLSALLGGAETSVPEVRANSIAAPARAPVLVVEDDRAIREGLQSVIESDGREAFGAANGKQALDVLRRIPTPGLILLDLMMPVMTGWELLEQLRADAQYADIPVVVISAVSKREEIGAMRVIQKPVEVNALISVVQELCG